MQDDDPSRTSSINANDSSSVNVGHDMVGGDVNIGRDKNTSEGNQYIFNGPANLYPGVPQRILSTIFDFSQSLHIGKRGCSVQIVLFCISFVLILLPLFVLILLPSFQSVSALFPFPSETSIAIVNSTPSPVPTETQSIESTLSPTRVPLSTYIPETSSFYPSPIFTPTKTPQPTATSTPLPPIRGSYHVNVDAWTSSNRKVQASERVAFENYLRALADPIQDQRISTVMMYVSADPQRVEIGKQIAEWGNNFLQNTYPKTFGRAMLQGLQVSAADPSQVGNVITEIYFAHR